MAFADLKTKWQPRQQEAFLSSLRRHAFPILGKRRVDRIDAIDVQEVLKPIWVEKVDIGRKVSQRIALVLNFSHSKGWRTTEAPSKAIATGLPKRTKAAGNYAAMPYAEVPAFVAKLKSRAETVGRLALLFAIYTAARSGEVRKARWSQIDTEQKLWKRPAEMMKMGRGHNVTLSEEALAVLQRAEPLRRGDGGEDLIFPSSKGTALSDATLSKILKVEGQPFTVHGFRSSFRDWAAEKMPNIPDPVAEAALAHVVADKVVAAYKRTPFDDMRRQLLMGWAKTIDGRQTDNGTVNPVIA